MTPRSEAAKALYQVIYKQRSLTDVFNQDITKLKPEEQAFVKDICFGSLRWHYPINTLLEQLLVKPLKLKDRDIECLLRVGLYQLAYQETPDHAAVNETVKASKALKKPWAKGLINGVMRNFIREKHNYLDSITGEIGYSFPSWLKKRVKKAWPEHWERILTASNQRAPMTLRVNLSKQSRYEYLARLDTVGISAKPHPSVNSAIVLDTPVRVSELPEFFEGAVSVQDAAAQMAAMLLKCESGMDVLDACAAPGGKTGHILESTTGLNVWALDQDPERLLRVDENLKRLQVQAKLVEADANNLSDWYDGKQFDRILLDAPCSATGVIRRHPDIKLLRKASDISQLVEQQSNLMGNLWSTLKPNGYMLYATCSILPKENEEQIEQFITRYQNVEVHPISVADKKVQQHGLQIFPGEGDMDGFYYCLLQKTTAEY
ncbi:MAG: Ribosomal RNA small subunit methyltransferase B (EC [uncultured Thiotrichaceae bacterium]|uniref:16S rRNA (cytosine(967)-C(5))-methyltransferase n=1 Tax=uncultured Thiotrichaceae bacterium TaxID=298394 RepID=A0A6S6TP24_9GAMM|nr:MAG: Ribosomal RNA small subunit methyltransferase B (EC [uncultured Thiotrichaceae bacterium]